MLASLMALFIAQNIFGIHRQARQQAPSPSTTPGMESVALLV
jgi:hypothetical protein